MKIGIQTNVWSETLHEAELATILSEAKAAGYDGFEIGYKRVNGRYTPNQLAQLAADAGLTLIGIHDGARFNSADWWNFGESRCLEVAQYAAAAGASFLMMSGQRSDAPPTDLERRADKLNTLGEIAKTEGVALCFHNHDWEFAHDAAEMNALVAQTDPELVSLLLDIGWVHRAGVETAVTIQQLLPRTANYHLKDDTLTGSWTELGQGALAWTALLAEIAKNQRDPWLIVERDEPLDNALESATVSAQFLRQQLAHQE